MEMSDRVYSRLHKDKRDIAVVFMVFMVDMPGSAKGRINQVEREALILLAESLETLVDRYALYGFFRLTRKRCEACLAKSPGEPMDDEVRSRMCGTEPKDYPRIGAPIRHLTRL